MKQTFSKLYLRKSNSFAFVTSERKKVTTRSNFCLWRYNYKLALKISHNSHCTDEALKAKTVALCAALLWITTVL